MCLLWIDLGPSARSFAEIYWTLSKWYNYKLIAHLLLTNISLFAFLKTSQIQYNLNILSIASSLLHHSNITFNFVFSIQYCLDCFEWQLEWREALHKYRSVAQINATHGFIVVFCQFLNFFSFMKMVKWLQWKAELKFSYSSS